MGVVFRARDERLDRDVALKILPRLEMLTDAALRQFRREALSLAKITDPHVAMAFDFGQDNGINYLVTEYVPGLTLEAKLAGRPLPEHDILRLGAQLASGLEAAHREGIVHRDLKPSNLKIRPDGQLKILDFGLAYALKQPTEATATAPLTETYSDAGTLPYMAPEQIKGVQPSACADLWSAGVVLYEMSTGKRPFREEIGARLIASILEQAPRPPRELNSKLSFGLERVILRALQKDPRERYQSAGDLRIDLSNLEAGTFPINWMQARAENLRWWVLSTVVLAVLFVGLWWRGHRRENPGREAKMLAVLPFESVANDSPTNALGMGLTETVTAKLVQAVDGGHLQLVSTRDLVQRGVKTSDEARREFGTDLVLEGSLQQDGQRLRVTWSLVDPLTHTQVAADTLTGNTGAIFELQDNICEEIMEKLRPTIEPELRQALQEHFDTKSAAYDSYLRGRGYLEDYQNHDNIEKAITEFQHAIDVDAAYAPAYAALGLAYNTGYQRNNRGKEWVEEARRNCQRALDLSAGLAEGHRCMGNVSFSSGRYQQAIQEFQRSLDLDHNNDETLRSLASAYQKLGKASDAEEAYRKAISVRPNYWAVYSAFGSFYYNQARYAEAVEMFRKAIRLSPLNHTEYSNLGAVYLLLGQYQESVEALKQSIALSATFEAYGNLGTVYFYMHRYVDSADTFEQAVKIDPQDWQNWGNLGDALFQIPARHLEARSDYQMAIRLAQLRLDVNPTDAFVLAFSADYYAILDDEGRAKKLIERALQIAPSDAEVLFRAAILYNHFLDERKTLKFLAQSVSAGYSRTAIRDTPDFDHLRNHPNFAY
jgi:tetratricopeptide (TPR) repeat protein